eukprot:365322-Chlamydomonas_euryale.AAC.1
MVSVCPNSLSTAAMRAAGPPGTGPRAGTRPHTAAAAGAPASRLPRSAKNRLSSRPPDIRRSARRPYSGSCTPAHAQRGVWRCWRGRGVWGALKPSTAGVSHGYANASAHFTDIYMDNSGERRDDASIRMERGEG